MNKERLDREIIVKLLEKYKYDCNGTEIENIVDEALESFMQYSELQSLDEISGFYRIYALMYWAIKDLQSQLDTANNKLDEIKKRYQMNRKTLEKFFLGKVVEIKLFDNEVIKGKLCKSRTEQFRNNPSLYIPKNYYFVINPQSCLFRLSHIKSIEVVSNE